MSGLGTEGVLLLLGLGTIALFIGVRDARPAPREAAGGGRRLAGTAIRRHGRRARTRELDPQPRPDRLDRGGAHDRARARDGRGRARRRRSATRRRGRYATRSRPSTSSRRRTASTRSRPQWATRSPAAPGSSSRRASASTRRSPTRPRPRSRAIDPQTIATFYAFDVDAGLGRDARRARRGRCGRDRVVRRGSRARGRRPLPGRDRERARDRPRRSRDLRPAGPGGAPGRGHDDQPDLRRELPATARPLHVREPRRRGDAGRARADRRRLPRREAPHRVRRSSRAGRRSSRRS